MIIIDNQQVKRLLYLCMQCKLQIVNLLPPPIIRFLAHSASHICGNTKNDTALLLLCLECAHLCPSAKLCSANFFWFSCFTATTAK